MRWVIAWTDHVTGAAIYDCMIRIAGSKLETQRRRERRGYLFSFLCDLRVSAFQIDSVCETLVHARQSSAR